VENPPAPLEPDKPAGLVGNGSGNFIAIPLAWKAFPETTPDYTTTVNADTDYKQYYTEPSERAFGNPASPDYYIELYQYKTGTPPNETLYGKYCWVADRGQEKWQDTNGNSKIDAGEIVSNFADGEDINTIVNYLGCSSCTYNTGGTFIFRDACASPIYITLAAKIASATMAIKYSTNKLKLELYQE
jgi:hypothetical protein